MDTFDAFMKKLQAGELDAFVKSEPIPETQGDVIVAVGKNFDDVITNSGRDALIEFYAPWCGHCKKLTPIYEELGELVSYLLTLNISPAFITRCLTLSLQLLVAYD